METPKPIDTTYRDRLDNMRRVKLNPEDAPQQQGNLPVPRSGALVGMIRAQQDATEERLRETLERTDELNNALDAHNQSLAQAAATVRALTEEHLRRLQMDGLVGEVAEPEPEVEYEPPGPDDAYEMGADPAVGTDKTVVHEVPVDA